MSAATQGWIQDFLMGGGGGGGGGLTILRGCMARARGGDVFAC